MEVIGVDHILNIDPDKTCRLCLSHSLNLHSIFSSIIIDGNITSVLDMLAYTVDISVCLFHPQGDASFVDILLNFFIG